SPSSNLLVQDDESGGNSQFQFAVNLEAGATYILVVTTYSPSVTGAFSICVTGPNRVSFPGNVARSPETNKI
ncbi:unnamed protein product, partial [Rotaria sp. Silwood1]